MKLGGREDISPDHVAYNKASRYCLEILAINCTRLPKNVSNLTFKDFQEAMEQTQLGKKCFCICWMGYKQVICLNPLQYHALGMHRDSVRYDMIKMALTTERTPFFRHTRLLLKELNALYDSYPDLVRIDPMQARLALKRTVNLVLNSWLITELSLDIYSTGGGGVEAASVAF